MRKMIAGCRKVMRMDCGCRIMNTGRQRPIYIGRMAIDGPQNAIPDTEPRATIRMISGFTFQPSQDTNVGKLEAVRAISHRSSTNLDFSKWGTGETRFLHLRSRTLR